MNLKQLGFAIALLCATSAVSAVEIVGMPVKLGNTVEEVQQALNTTMEPEEVNSAIPSSVKKTQLRLKTKGIWVFFEKGKTNTIRVDAPFSGSVGGIKLGDPSAKITKTLGKPIKEAKFGLSTTYTYYFDDVTTTKFVVNTDDEVETVFFTK